MGSFFSSRPMGWSLFLLLLAPISIGQSAFALDADLVFVQVPNDVYDIETRFDPAQRYVDGCRIVCLQRDGELVILTPEFASACDPAVSFDGESIYFSGKQQPADDWQLWRMDADGDNKTHIDTGLSDCVSPLPTGNLFHLNDASPSPRMVFVSSDHDWQNEGSGGKAYSLYACWMDGSGVQRLTYNLSSDFDPSVLPNGRVLFSSWQRFFDGSPGSKLPTAKLLAINIDGADAMLYAGTGKPLGHIIQSAPSPGGRVYFVEDGALSYVEQRRPLHTYQTLARGIFQSPCSINAESLIVSTLPNWNDVYSLVRLSTKTGEAIETVFKEDQHHCLDAQVLAPHPKTDGRSSVVNVEKTIGELYCLNVYESQIDAVAKLSPGSVKHVRVIEGLPIKKTWLPNTQAVKSPQRVLGVAPVEKDGSFHLNVPGDTPFALQLIDGAGEVIETHRNWMWVRPGERRGCIGCHEDPELTPPNRLSQAIVKPAFDVTQPLDNNERIDFLTSILPIIERKCSTCHNAIHKLDLSVDPAGSRRRPDEIHENLLYGEMNYVNPGFSDTSPLMKILMMEPHEIEQKTQTTFQQWIDRGAHYSIWQGEPK